MTKVELEELRVSLSQYLEQARGGESVIVTDCGEPVVELAPISATKRELIRLAEIGEISWNGGKPRPLGGIVVRGEPISETVIKGRR